MVLVLGRPGSGCSTLLSALAGRLATNVTQTVRFTPMKTTTLADWTFVQGTILYNGQPSIDGLQRQIRHVLEEVELHADSTLVM